MEPAVFFFAIRTQLYVRVGRDVSEAVSSVLAREIQVLHEKYLLTGVVPLPCSIGLQVLEDLIDDSGVLCGG